MTPQAVVLGSGTSSGVPAVGKSYSPEFLANPKNHRYRPALLLRGPEGNVLVDCPPELRLQLLRAEVTDLESAILTHTHADHLMGMDDLRAFCKRGASFPIYTAPRYQDDVRRVFDYAFAEFPPGVWVPRFDLRDVEPEMWMGGLRIQTFWVEHGKWPVLALRVNDFAYVTDVSRIPDEVWPKLQGLEVLVLDAVRHRPHPNHLHTEAAIDVARRVGAATTYFTHLSDEYDHDRSEAELPSTMKLAYDGLVVSL